MSAERREALARVLWEAFDRPVYGLKAEWCQIATDTVTEWFDRRPTDRPDPNDERNPKQCPRCHNWCIYDGWDHVHAYGIGIGSCRFDQHPTDNGLRRELLRLAEWCDLHRTSPTTAELRVLAGLDAPPAAATGADTGGGA